jgi:thiamine pyrophosphate-dependent acetolactate synthase large subunit-like protein
MDGSFEPAARKSTGEKTMAHRSQGPRAAQDVDRRKFLKGVAVAGAAGAVVPQAAEAAGAAGAAPARLPSALPPTAQTIAAETGVPQAEMNRIGGVAGSDYMVDVIKSLDIKYLPANCASSYRGIHESLINYGGNKMPEFLTCTHEESAVGMAQGYFKATGKPLMTLVHGTVGLQHAAMAVYNAWCDRVPVIIMGGNDLDAAHRPPGVPTFHSAQDINALVRDFTKWDDTPVSLQHFGQSFVRAYKIATTPPYGPVMISLDAGLQQEPINTHNGEKLYVPRFVPSSPPQGDSGAVKEAARLLASAERPLIVADRAARTENGMRLVIQLAELLQARVIDLGGRMNFPRTHHLSTGRAAVSTADVILGMEVSDFWGIVNGYVDNGEHGIGHNVSKIKPGTKLITINSVELITKSNYQDFQRFQSVDVSMPADAEATLPALIEAVKAAIANERKAAIEKRGEAARKAKAEAVARNHQLAAIAWDASPISTARLVMEIWGQIKNEDWSLVSQSGNVSNWQHRLWPIEKYHHWLGGSGGYGVGYGAAGSVGGALGNRDLGRFSVSIQSDGDLMYAPGVLWTAAKHKIPLLAVMHNNRGYHQELMHVQRMSSFRNRVASLGNDFGPIGTSIMNPDIEYHKLAESMGWWAKGPIKDPAALGPAIKEAAAVVKSGQPALVNVWTQPR